MANRGYSQSLARIANLDSVTAKFGGLIGEMLGS